MGVTLRQIEDAGALDEIGRVCATREDALSLIGSVPFLNAGDAEDLARLPAFRAGAANDYFRSVARIVVASEGESGLGALLAAAARLFPAGAKLGPYARPSPHASSAEPARTLALAITLHDDIAD